MSVPPSAQRPPSLLSPRYLVPFLLVSLIWGGTWLVIRDQIASVPASWSIAYRFIVAAVGMFALAAWQRQSLALDGRGQALAALMGLFQFTLNFTFVYNAEHYVTSGLVAVLFALLMVPNAIMGRMFLGQPITRNFIIGSAIAALGIALLFAHEYRAAPTAPGQVLLGVALTAGGILSASSANILQATSRAKAYPILTLLAWSMLWGVGINSAIALATVGPPQFDLRPGFFLGIAFLGLLGSVVTFPLYYGLVREIGAGKAAYTGVLIPVVAMILSTLFEGFVWSLLAASGALLALIGMVIALRTAKK